MTNTNKIPKSIQKYVGCVRGEWAPGDRVPVTVTMSRCQRPLQLQNVYKYIARKKGLDRSLFGYLTVIRCRATGRLACVNGHHRLRLAMTVDPTIQEVPAHIIDVEPGEFETYGAENFIDINANFAGGGVTKPLTNEEIFWAQIIAQDSEALRYQQILTQAGLRCGRVNEDHSRYPVEYATFVKCVKLSDTATVRAAQLLIQGFNRVNTDVLHGLVFLLSNSHYRDLATAQTAIGQHFEKWLTQMLPQFISISNLKFECYRQGPWQKGIAYGIVQAFAQRQRNQGLVAPAVTPMEEIWRAGWASRDSGGLGKLMVNLTPVMD